MTVEVRKTCSGGAAALNPDTVLAAEIEEI
jgi:hypothetical protein